MKKTTMQDIADALNISRMTVSKAFTGDSDISNKTKELIFKKAIELGYKYNKNKSLNILVLTKNLFVSSSEEFYTGLYKRLSEIASMKNIMLSLVAVKDEEFPNLKDSIRKLSFDAIIVLGQIPKEYLLEIQTLNKPMVCIDFYYRNVDIDTVYSDNFTASYEITSYLIDKKHTKIGFVGTLNSTVSINDRYFGYYKALLENNIEINQDYLFSDRNITGEQQEIDIKNDIPTAFVCNNDHTAYLLIKKLISLGYNVPKDVAVVGFDDVIYSTVSNPQITTMRVPRKMMAETAIDLLIKRMGNPQATIRKLKVECKLVERESA